MKVPKTIWVGWCHTCGHWLDETETARSASDLVRSEHPEHLKPGHPWLDRADSEERPCVVEVIPFRVDRKAARRVRSKNTKKEAP